MGPSLAPPFNLFSSKQGESSCHVLTFWRHQASLPASSPLKTLVNRRKSTWFLRSRCQRKEEVREHASPKNSDQVPAELKISNTTSSPAATQLPISAVLPAAFCPSLHWGCELLKLQFPNLENTFSPQDQLVGVYSKKEKQCKSQGQHKCHKEKQVVRSWISFLCYQYWSFQRDEVFCYRG